MPPNYTPPSPWSRQVGAFIPPLPPRPPPMLSPLLSPMHAPLPIMVQPPPGPAPLPAPIKSFGPAPTPAPIPLPIKSFSPLGQSGPPALPLPSGLPAGLPPLPEGGLGLPPPVPVPLPLPPLPGGAGPIGGGASPAPPPSPVDGGPGPLPPAFDPTSLGLPPPSPADGGGFDPSQAFPPVDPGVLQGGDLGPGDLQNAGGVPGIPSPPGGIVLPSDVDQLKQQIIAKVSRIDGALGNCPPGAVDPNAWQAAKDAALAFANSSTLGGVVPGIFGGQGQDFPAQMAIGQGILAGLDGFEQTLASQCGLAPPPAPQPTPNPHGQDPFGLGNLGIGLGLAGAAIIAALLVLGRK